MKAKLYLPFLCCVICTSLKAQNDTSAKQHNSHLGDQAPALRVASWIKGAPVDSFQKGKVYVVEFWATWCGPCRAVMPHLSALAKLYSGKVTIIGVDVWEKSVYHPKSKESIKGFVDSMGSQMSYNVALEDSDFTANDWLKAYKQQTIPVAFVINGDKNVAWVGHPKDLDTVLSKVLKNDWDLKKQISLINSENYLDSLDNSITAKVERFEKNTVNLGSLGLPDSVIHAISDMVKSEPRLQYMPNTTYHTFSALLKIDPLSAKEYGQKAVAGAQNRDGVLASIIKAIRDDMARLSTPKPVMAFGAECLQTYIADYDKTHDLLLTDLAEQYKELAEWYRRGGMKAEALEAEKTAVKFWEKDLVASAK